MNLNYTVSSEVINHCIAQAGIRHVLTSRKFMEKVKLDIDAQLVFLEDFRNQARFADKAACALAAYAVPARAVEWSLGLREARPDDLATVIFTSGSTGEPKGVMLTERNISSNVQAIRQLVRLSRQDVLVGILPFFHSFGFTVCLWTTGSIDIKGVFHFNPLEGKQVGKLCKAHGGTVMLATPTFLRTYQRRCAKEDFATLDVVVTGAEKLPSDVCDAFDRAFGVRPVEGYGTTELSPLVSVNIPPSRALGDPEDGLREGSVGRPIPHVRAKVTDLDTGEELGAGQSGMLWIKGPNVMKGYLGRDDLTAEVIHDGWYMTGDVAKIDEDGFIYITGRESRFSKIGGEMVPHIQIEEALNEVLDAGDDGILRAVVTAVPDAKKGERLVVLHTEIEKSPGQLRTALSERGLPNLYIPAENSFHQIDEIPVLGTGKLDLSRLKQMALEIFASAPQ